MLDRQNVARFAEIKRLETPVTEWSLYEYNADIGWRWLQHIAFALLNWIGAHHRSTITTFERSVRENDNLLHSLLGQEGMWIEFVHCDRYRPCIYMGPDDHADLMHLCHFQGMAPVDLTGRIETRDQGSVGKWHDIPIFVVPWMQGAVIVPR